MHSSGSKRFITKLISELFMKLEVRIENFSRTSFWVTYEGTHKRGLLHWKAHILKKEWQNN